MAGANQRQTFDKRVNTSEGHYVKWEVSVRNLRLLQAWRFAKKYRSFCETSPTSWDFKMSFPEVREDGTATISVSLKRTDTLNIDLDATVWVDFGDPSEHHIFPKQSFMKGGMAPGSEMEESVELEPCPYMGAAIHQPLVVIVTLMVSSCHSNE